MIAALWLGRCARIGLSESVRGADRIHGPGGSELSDLGEKPKPRSTLVAEGGRASEAQIGVTTHMPCPLRILRADLLWTNHSGWVE